MSHLCYCRSCWGFLSSWSGFSICPESCLWPERAAVVCLSLSSSLFLLKASRRVSAQPWILLNTQCDSSLVLKWSMICYRKCSENTLWSVSALGLFTFTKTKLFLILLHWPLLRCITPKSSLHFIYVLQRLFFVGCFFYILDTYHCRYLNIIWLLCGHELFLIIWCWSPLFWIVIF